MSKAFCVSLALIALPVGALADAPEDWPPYFEPRALRDVTGTADGQKLELPRAFVFHREDVEKIHVLRSELDTCKDSLKLRQEQDPIAPPFWSTAEGRWLLAGIGFVGGVVVTVGVVYAVGTAR